MHLKRLVLSVLSVLGLFALAPAGAADVDEFKVKREAVFEFAQKPQVTRSGDLVTIAFESKGFCDATIAIEDANGKIVRHLVSGVLGPRAPEPLQPNSKKQAVVWDGKTDKGEYPTDREALTVRVSLGLKPQFERDLYWSPYKRVGEAAPLIAANEEGVFVCEGKGIDRIRMFDHEGKYVRTVYPFPAERLSAVKGLDWRDFPQGVRYPWKQSLYQQTFFTSGDNCSYWDLGGMSGRAASAIALNGNRLALAALKLNRISTDGTSGGQELGGGFTSFELPRFHTWAGVMTIRATPTSMALSPDGKWAYCAGFAYRIPSFKDTLNAVARVALDGTEDAKVFLGKVTLDEHRTAAGGGSGPGEFKNATSVDCDGQGRVYVSDFMNDRVQVFSPDGKYLKEIKTPKPAVVKINRKSGEIWVFSWLIASRYWQAAEPAINVTSTLTRFKSFDDPQEIGKSQIPMGKTPHTSNGKIELFLGSSSALWFTVDVDFWANPVTLWLGNDSWAGGAVVFSNKDFWENMGVRLLREKDGKWEVVRDFAVETRKQVPRGKPPTNAIQRLEVNPVNGKLYVGEADSGPTYKSSNQLLEIDPENGKIKIIDMPFSPMEYVFDLDGNIYLRNTDLIVRYDSVNYREIPFDYGEERSKVGELGSGGVRTAEVIAGLPLPSKNTVCFHQGGINVNAKGKIIASCGYRFVGIGAFKPGVDPGVQAATGAWSQGAMDMNALAAQGGKPYLPPLYPGRISSSTTPCIHVWDKHGKLIYADAVPGAAQVDGVGIDRDDNIYMMHTPSRMVDGKKYLNQVSETLMKVKPKQAKIYSASKSASVPLEPEAVPKRSPDLYAGDLGAGWVEGAEWFYGGVGFAGFNAGHAPSCACWFSRFALDYYARSIAPEPQLFSVAVLDKNGNLILRLGRYGNVDDGKPLVPSAEQPAPHALGGDEVSLFHACYVGTHTDRRIFISDVGNGRILSVKLDYHAEEKVALKDVADATKK